MGCPECSFSANALTFCLALSRSLALRLFPPAQRPARRAPRAALTASPTRPRLPTVPASVSKLCHLLQDQTARPERERRHNLPQALVLERKERCCVQDTPTEGVAMIVGAAAGSSVLCWGLGALLLVFARRRGRGKAVEPNTVP